MSAPSFLVVSFYTLGTGYEREINERLVPSLRAHGLGHEVVGIESRGSWGLNIFQKAYVIADMLRKHPSRNIVWLDADAVVVRYPDLFDTTDCDFGCHFRYGRKLSSGTMFLRNNEKVADLVSHWVQVIEARGGDTSKTEQQLLLEILPAHTDLRIGRFPLEYSTIFDGEQTAEPVIVHYQASRRFKAGIG